MGSKRLKTRIVDTLDWHKFNGIILKNPFQKNTEIADQMNLSMMALCMVIKEKTGKTFLGYKQDLVLRKINERVTRVVGC